MLIKCLILLSAAILLTANKIPKPGGQRGEELLVAKNTTATSNITQILAEFRELMNSVQVGNLTDDDDFGIRIEDIVQIVPAQTAYNFSNRGALSFRTVTMCPKQTKMIKKELMSEAEVMLLNSYHQLVWDTLAPILAGQRDLITLSWLKKEVKGI